MLDVGIPELLIILALIIIVFGPGRIAGLGQALGGSIREFRTSMRDETDNETTSALTVKEKV